MTKRLELYEWTESRKSAEIMYSIARSYLLHARDSREKARLSTESTDRAFLKGVAVAYRCAAMMILTWIRDGRNLDDFQWRKLVREATERTLADRPAKGWHGAVVDAYMAERAGLNNPEFDPVSAPKHE